MQRSWWACGATLALVWSWGVPTSAVELQDVLKFTPKQKDVDYEIPKAEQTAKCKVEVERVGKLVGWVVIGPEGQILRRFYDTDGDNRVDQWRYYQHGLEVYRDIDTNKDDKPDQFRWLNLGGSRWGIDKNGDQRIDEWKSLSAAEASREAIRAMTTGDAAALKAIMITPDDLRALGVNSTVSAKLLEGTSNLAAGMKAAEKSKALTAQSKWIRFDAQMPGAIPADEGKATTDLHVYENAMVVVEPGPALVQIGEMIRVGDVWKLTQVPQPIEINGEKGVITAGGVLMQPLLAGTTEATLPSSPEVEKLVKALQDLDQKQPQMGVAKPAELAAYNNRRADMLMQLHDLATGAEEKEQFLKQCADGLASAVQTGAFPQGMERLTQLETQVRKGGSAMASAVPYVAYRRMQAKYSLDMNSAEADKRDEIQKAFMSSLVEFIDRYPQAEDTPDAMWTVATAEEFTNRMKEATEWYQKLAKHPGNSPTIAKAAGALRRLELKGKAFAITGKDLAGNPVNTAQFRGRGPVLVVFWATWCDPFKTDLPQLRALYQQYHDRGFEIVGVCLDVPLGPPAGHNKQIQDFLVSNKVNWPQIMEPAGLDSAPAVQYGVFSLPTMILVSSRGEVLSRNSSVTELKTVLPNLLDKK